MIYSKHIVLIIFIIALFFKHSYSQNNTLEYYYQQGLKLQAVDLDSASYYFLKVDSIAFEKIDSHKITQSAIFLSGYYANLGLNDKVKSFIKRALPYANTTDSSYMYNTLTSIIGVYNPQTTDSLFQEGIELALRADKRDLTPLYNNYAGLLHKKGDLGQAAFYYQQAAENALNDFAKYQTYISMLNIFEALGNNSLTSEYIDKASIIAEKNNYKSRNGILALHKVKHLVKTNKIKEAKLELEKGLSFESRLKPKSYEISKVITSRMYYTATKEWVLWQKYLNDRKNIYKIYNLNLHPTILNAKAKCSYELEEYSQAENWARQALTESKNKNLKSDEIRACTLLGKIYTAQQKYNEAIKYKDISKEESDQYFRNKKTQNIIYLEAAYNRKEQQQAIKELNRDNQIQEENIIRKNLYLKLGALALVLFSILIFILYRLYKKVNQQKKIISKSLTEKDLLLREIHHRVKNNLQLVSSLLTMQGRSIDDQSTIQAINEGKSRVRSMALIHQDLYNRENITGISVKDYIEKLAKELFYTYKITNDRIRFELEIEDIELDIDTVVPIGLILNELITNSLKYAWPEENNGVLTITLKKSNKSTRLTVKDDGIGYIPKEVREGSFGATLISALTQQLNGELNVKIDDGTETTIIIHNTIF